MGDHRSDAVVGKGNPPVTPSALQSVSRMPELSEISPKVAQECLQFESQLDSYERWSMRAAAIGMLAAVATRYTHYRATGNWGEGMAHFHYRTVKEWAQGLFSDDALPTPTPDAPPDLGTVVLTGIAGFALGASVIMSGGHASLQEVYNKKCEGFIWARIGAGQTSVEKYLDEFAALGPVELPQSLVATDAAAIDYIPSVAGTTSFRSSTSPHWIDGASRFARHHPEVAASVMTVAVIAAGAAIYFSGGSALVFAL